MLPSGMLLTPEESKSERENGSDGGVKHETDATPTAGIGEKICGAGAIDLLLLNDPIIDAVVVVF